MEEFDVLVLGGLYPEKLMQEVLDKSSGTPELASNAHLRLVLGGLDAAFGRPVTLFNLVPIGSWPKRYQDAKIPRFSFAHTPGAKDLNLGFSNVTLIKKLSKRRSLLKEIKKWAATNREKQKILFLYTLQSHYLDAAAMVKKRCPAAHVCLMVPDLPAFTDIDKAGSLLHRLFTAHRVHSTFRKLPIADSFVFLTKSMADYFQTKKPYTVIEGMVDPALDFPSAKKADALRVVTYTGTFTKKYGIMELVNAFMQLSDDAYRLVLCGGGEAEPDLRRAAARDKRILLKGTLPREEALRLQRESTILVNPRGPEGEYTKYSFPSKLMEYMLSGRPVLCYRLPGIPAEYDAYLNYISGSLAESIQALCRLSEDALSSAGARAKDFVLSQKTNVAQMQKAVDMMKGCLQHE